MIGTRWLCPLVGHRWGIAGAEKHWWLCDRCGADQLAWVKDTGERLAYVTIKDE